MNQRISTLNCVLLVFAAMACAGCISTGETIRVSGEVVNEAGERLNDAVVTGSASKRGGTIVRPGEWSDPDSVDESREVVIKNHGDGTFTARSHWAGTLTLSVQGYKIRRVDDLDTAFLVPSRSFFKSQDQVRLEVVKDE